MDASLEKNTVLEENKKLTDILRWLKSSDLMNKSGIQGRFREASFEKWDEALSGQKKAGLFARNYVNAFRDVRAAGRSAVFVGNTGTGKTYLASAIGLELIRRGYTVRYTTAFDAFVQFRKTLRSGSDHKSESQFIAELASSHLLILDEAWGSFCKETEREMEILFHILDHRYTAKLPSILISHLPTSDLRQFLSDRVSDRLNENGLDVVAFDWTSRR